MEQTKHTEGPWTVCGASEGKCQCGQIWCRDYPVATVTIGEWGDKYPAIRVKNPGAIAEGAEPYMEHIIYGKVNADTAFANAALIAAAPDLLEAARLVVDDSNDSINTDDQRGTVWKFSCEAMNKLVAAIAKAEE